MDTGTRLKALRLEKDLTQQDLATKIGCNRRAVSDYEKNRGDMSIKTIEKLCHLFNVSADYLIYGVPCSFPKEITIEEIRMVLKYRALSDYYKSMIDHILDLGENFNTDNK